MAPWTGTVRYRITAEGWLQLEGERDLTRGTRWEDVRPARGLQAQDGEPTDGPRDGVQRGRDAARRRSVSIQNGAATNVNAGAVSYVQIAGSGPYTGGTVVHLDGIRLPTRPTEGQMW